MDGWVEREFNLPGLGPCVVPVAGNGDYSFNWGAHAEPFADHEFP